MPTFHTIAETIQVMILQEIDYECPTILRTKEDIRSKMVDWCCRVVTYCKLELEIVAIAMNYTDRMCMYYPNLLCDVIQYQLTAMTSLYTAAKIHAQEALDPKLVSNLSHGTYSADDIEKQERWMLKTLQWKVNPITSHSMLRQFFEMVDNELTVEEKEAALKFALQQLDTFTWKQSCTTTVRSSIVAYCAFMNALGFLSLITVSDNLALFSIGYSVAQMINIDLVMDEMVLAEAQYMLGSVMEVKPTLYGRKQASTSIQLQINQKKRIRSREESSTSVTELTAIEQEQHERLTVRLLVR
jgi:Cyclin, N-terminal domain